MTAVEEPRTEFVRPDGREKVTGTGRYTADLTFTGEAHAAFRYADHPHARIVRIDTTKARALPGVLAVVTHEDVPGRPLRRQGQGSAPLRAGHGALRGRHRRRRGGLTAEIARRPLP